MASDGKCLQVNERKSRTMYELSRVIQVESLGRSSTESEECVTESLFIMSNIFAKFF